MNSHLSPFERWAIILPEPPQCSHATLQKNPKDNNQTTTKLRPQKHSHRANGTPPLSNTVNHAPPPPILSGHPQPTPGAFNPNFCHFPSRPFLYPSSGVGALSDRRPYPPRPHGGDPPPRKCLSILRPYKRAQDVLLVALVFFFYYSAGCSCV